MRCDVRGHAVAHRLLRHLHQGTVAAGAACEEKFRPRHEREPRPQLGHLFADRPSAQEHDPRPRNGRQPAVACEQPASLGPGLSRHSGVGDIGEERGVEPREPQPPGEAPEHGITGEAQLPHGHDSSVLA